MKKEYKLNKEWLDLMLENKNNANLTFNLSNNDIRILLTYIEVLQQENARLKDKLIEINKVIDGYIPNEHAMCKAFDEIEFIIKEDNKEVI